MKKIRRRKKLRKIMIWIVIRIIELTKNAIIRIIKGWRDKKIDYKIIKRGVKWIGLNKWGIR